MDRLTGQQLSSLGGGLDVERIADAWRDRVIEAIRERVGDVIRERLTEELRRGALMRGGFGAGFFAPIGGGGVETGPIADAMRRRLADALRERVGEAIREHVADELYGAIG